MEDAGESKIPLERKEGACLSFASAIDCDSGAIASNLFGDDGSLTILRGGRTLRG
jgi:hypothetical protein